MAGSHALSMDSNNILSGLNSAQKTAVTSPASVLQILAPPGSGKTKTLTSRVAWLLSDQHLQPWNIIVATFTVKAAREMKERIGHLIGDGLEKKLILGTFHSIARRYLVRYGHLIGLDKNFGIADSADSLAIIKRIVKRRKLNVDPGVARSRISSLKARGLSPEEYDAASKKSVEKQEFSRVYEDYESALQVSNLLDYDDLLLRCVLLLREHPVCVSNVEAVLVDEFQDTNVIQFELMNLFAMATKNLTIVGDPDQSIYGFRSAEIKNLQRMVQQYPETLVVHLEENYRSSGAILLAALELIQQDTSRPSRPLLATHCLGSRPVLRRIPSAAIEAKWIVTEVKRFIALTGNLLNFADVAILIRSASLSRHIESALGQSGIPYRMVGGHRFFDRVEIKVILDYLRVISQPDNNDALARIIPVPSRRIGETTIKNLLEEANSRQISLWSLIKTALQGNLVLQTKVSKAGEQGMSTLLNLILTARYKMSGFGESWSLKELVQFIMQKISYEGFLRRTYPEDCDSRLANVEELIAQASEISRTAEAEGDMSDDLPEIGGVEQQRPGTVEDMLARFLANVALSSEAKVENDDTSKGQVTISTIHAAKGLEWPVVFIPGAYEGSIPHSRSEDTDEERRLLYVAMTRAQCLLYLSCPLKNSQRESTTLSPFLTEKSLLPHLESLGPDLQGVNLCNEIAQILRRPAATTSQVMEASQSLESLKDDLWPASGEEEDPKSQALFLEDSEDITVESRGGSKRRRLEKGANDVMSWSKPVVNPASGYVSTMQNQTSFSVSCTTMTTGFISASTHLHDQNKRKIEATSHGPPRRSHMNPRENQGTISRAPVCKGTVLSKAKPSGQRALTSFFQKDMAKTGRVGACPDGSTGVRRGAAYDGLQPTSADDTAPSDSDSIFEWGLCKSNAEDELELPPQRSQPAVPTPVIDAPYSYLTAFGSHRPRMVRTETKPSKLLSNDESDGKRYVFLSSSPPRNEDAGQGTTCRQQDDSRLSGLDTSTTLVYRKVDPPLLQRSTNTVKFTEGNTVRKTLGVRRSLNGWAERRTR